MKNISVFSHALNEIFQLKKKYLLKIFKLQMKHMCRWNLTWALSLYHSPARNYVKLNGNNIQHLNVEKSMNKLGQGYNFWKAITSESRTALFILLDKTAIIIPLDSRKKQKLWVKA